MSPCSVIVVAVMAFSAGWAAAQTVPPPVVAPVPSAEQREATAKSKAVGAMTAAEKNQMAKEVNRNSVNPGATSFGAPGNAKFPAGSNYWRITDHAGPSGPRPKQKTETTGPPVK